MCIVDFKTLEIYSLHDYWRSYFVRDYYVEIDFDDIKEDYLISDIIYETKSRWDYDQLAEENDLMIQKVAEILKEEPQALTFAMEALSYARER